MKKKKIWGITLAAIMVTSVIGSSTAVFAGEKTGGDIPPAQMAEVSQDKLLSEIDALADEYNRIYDSHIDLWDKLYDAYNSLEADYDFEDFDENSQVEIEIEPETLFYNMLAAGADYLYGLPQWTDILGEDKMTEIAKKYKKSKTVVKDKKIGRNEPCPCGSGKKYKHCCGR